MIQCPSCRAMIPDDSAFCDQCGIELMWCPDCKRPKSNRTRECPVCGSDLVSGRKYLNGNMDQPQPMPQQPQQPNPSTAGAFTSSQAQFYTNPQHVVQPPQPNDGSQRTAISGASAPAGPTKIIGNGWVLPLREGPFGRTSGIYPDSPRANTSAVSMARSPEQRQDGWSSTVVPPTAHSSTARGSPLVSECPYV